VLESQLSSRPAAADVDVLVVGGEASGTAAALSLVSGVTPRRLDAGKLRDQLRQQGGIIDKQDIARCRTAK
jgi:hypothetical protein